MGRQSKYRKVEELLRNYKMLQISICNVEEELELLSQESGVGGMSYDEIGGGSTGMVSDMVASIAIAKLEEVDILERELAMMRDAQRSIEDLFVDLSSLDKEIVSLRHGKGKDWEYIANKVGYSIAYCQELRRKAIESLLLGV